jgi:outer membrane biosynthesis protein TonB
MNRPVIAAVILATLAGVSSGQATSQKTRRNTLAISDNVACFRSFRVSQGASGRPVLLTTKELDQMATARKMPTFPPMSARITGSLRVKVLIDELGRIRCAVLVQGHPILARAVTNTFPAWRFRPYMHKGKPSPVMGFLDYRFEASDPRLVFLDLNFAPH